MLELNVNARSAASISAAFKKIREMVKTGTVSNTTPVHIVLEAGTYAETVKYNLSNPLIMESASGTKAENCIIQAENCENFHKGVENRAVFTLGPNVTKVTLKNFTIINTHKKSITESNTLPDTAEALVWDNSTGTLFAEGLKLESKQGVLFVKGFSWFSKCSVTGDIDLISGYCDTAYFEDCKIHINEDPRGDYNGYAVKSLALANKPGFIFDRCIFTGAERKKSNLYIMRTAGKGSINTLFGWDSVALLNCQTGTEFNQEFGWDDDLSLEVYPRGNTKTGWREYKTQVISKEGTLTPADTLGRNVKSYVMTDDDFFANYASRFLILKNTPFAVQE